LKNLTVWKIYCRSLKKREIEKRVLVYPSESVFALGGNPFCPKVLSSIELYKHTKNSTRKAFILLVNSFEEALLLGDFCVEEYQKLIKELPPNTPLTLIGKANSLVPKKLCYQSKVAIRIVRDPFLKILLNIFPFPLISTSLNPPKKHPTTLNIKAKVFAKRRNLDAFFVAKNNFTSKKTSRIYDIVEKKWLR
jgi:tRNA A37 threonylcarbamoyladenosine synthetase subunit TsaC/SUA5/YrdC